MRAADMTLEEGQSPAILETYIEGPRWALPEGTIRKFVLRFNSVLRDKGWENIEILYERRTTSLLSATLFFRLEGPGYPLQSFAEILQDCIRECA